MLRALLVVAVAAMLGVAGCTPAPHAPDPSMPAQVKADIAQIMSDISRAEETSPEVGLSSNPYSYVGISPAFQRLVDRGQPALDPIVAEIENSKENGLLEYLLAIAGQEILNAPTPEITVDTGKAWARWYRTKMHR